MLKEAKWLQRMVQEMDGLKYSVLEEPSAEPAEDIPPLPDHVLNPPEPTPEEKEAVEIYEKALTLLNRTRPNKREAYALLQAAAQKGNLDAKALVAWATLFGSPLAQDLKAARQMLSELSDKGHSDGHMGMGKIFATIGSTLWVYL